MYVYPALVCTLLSILRTENGSCDFKQSSEVLSHNSTRNSSNYRGWPEIQAKSGVWPDFGVSTPTTYHSKLLPFQV